MKKILDKLEFIKGGVSLDDIAQIDDTKVINNSDELAPVVQNILTNDKLLPSQEASASSALTAPNEFQGATTEVFKPTKLKRTENSIVLTIEPRTIKTISVGIKSYALSDMSNPLDSVS